MMNGEAIGYINLLAFAAGYVVGIATIVGVIILTGFENDK
jgi:hypothetical protein